MTITANADVVIVGAGFAGLSMIFSRYLLSIGLPFEQWLHFLADLSRAESRPEQFLKEACAGLGGLPWVTGGAWHTSSDSGEFGSSSEHSVEFAGRELTIRLYSRHRPGPFRPALWTTGTAVGAAPYS